MRIRFCEVNRNCGTETESNPITDGLRFHKNQLELPCPIGTLMCVWSIQLIMYSYSI